jgi:hypothetical protein
MAVHRQNVLFSPGKRPRYNTHTHAQKGGDETMPVYDWTRVEAGIFHDFHTVWTGALRNALNGDLLPEGYYALAEQHAGRAIADVLTLHASPKPQGPAWWHPDTGGIAVAVAPPRVLRKQTVEPSALGDAAPWRFVTLAATG